MWEKKQKNRYTSKEQRVIWTNQLSTSKRIFKSLECFSRHPNGSREAKFTFYFYYLYNRINSLQESRTPWGNLFSDKFRQKNCKFVCGRNLHQKGPLLYTAFHLVVNSGDMRHNESC